MSEEIENVNSNENIPNQDIQGINGGYQVLQPNPEQTNIPNEANVTPSLAKRMHIKFVVILLFFISIIWALIYYQNHSLPDFISSSADSLIKNQKNQTILSPTTIIEGQATNSGVATQMIVQSVGRSETTYTLISAVPAEEQDTVQLPIDEEEQVESSPPLGYREIVITPIPLNTADDYVNKP